MSPEEKALLERTYRLTEENNNMLRSLRRAQRFGTAFRVLYWTLIIVTSFGAYYFVQPYLKAASGVYGTATDSVAQFRELLSDFSNTTK